MAYVEAHAGLRNHPKTKKVARLLDIPKPQAIGHLLCLWWWCQEYAQDGDLSKYSEEDIADAADWTGDAKAFVDALLNCGNNDQPGFLALDDGILIIHDWYDYGGKLFVKREQGARRTAAWRARNAAVTPSNDDTSVSNASLTRHERVSDAHRQDKTRQEETREEESRQDKTPPTPPTVAAPIGLKAWTKEAQCQLQQFCGLFITSDPVRDEFKAITKELYDKELTDWLQQAIDASAAQNVHTWSYVKAVLNRCLKDGMAPGSKPPSRHTPNGNGYRPSPALEALRMTIAEDEAAHGN